MEEAVVMRREVDLIEFTKRSNFFQGRVAA